MPKTYPNMNFNNRCLFTAKETLFIINALTDVFDYLDEDKKICVISPIHHSKDDILPHFTFRIWDKKKNAYDGRRKDFHGYVWTEDDGSYTLEFITQFEFIEKKVVVF